LYRNFNEVIDGAKKKGCVRISVAAAQDREVLEAVKEAYVLGLADPILVGDASAIKPLLSVTGLPENIRIVDVKDLDQAALKAVELVHNGEADVLMKGLINSSNFLRAALNEEVGLRSGKMLCHFAAFEIPGEKKLAYYVDGGMNIAPNLEQKKQITTLAVNAVRLMGIDRPNVAKLTANEQVNPKMPATMDAKALVDMWEAGEFPPCIMEGPIAMDVAASAEAAHHKGIDSKIAGDVDIFVVPTIEAGNMIGKTLVYYAKAKIAGAIIGATNPIVMTSRADTAEAKLHSIALACAITERGNAPAGEVLVKSSCCA
jgi:phosphate butyryltransferase